jgi:etoposide-induced 2.4 mRNA
MLLQGIIVAMWRGFVDSLRGAVVLFSMDKQINEKLKKSPQKTDPRRRESQPGHSPPKYPRHHR